jgi:hypothetical protein
VTDDGHPEVRWSRDVAAGSWLGPRLHPFGDDVGSVVPEGFEAYVRVFHPIEPLRAAGRPCRWPDVAVGNSRIVHAEM